MDVSRSGRRRKKSSLLVDFDTTEASQNAIDENVLKPLEISPEEILEGLDGLVEENFRDSLASTIVTTGKSLYLSIWKQPQENWKKNVRMSFLPLFYIICSVEKTRNLVLKLIAYNGKVVEEIEGKGSSLKDEEKIDFIRKLCNLTICPGISIPDNLPYNRSSLHLIYKKIGLLKDHNALIEQVEDDILVRSTNCLMGMDNSVLSCEYCQTIGDALGKDSSLADNEAETTFNDKFNEDEEPMESESLEISDLDKVEQDATYKNEESMDDDDDNGNTTQITNEAPKKTVKPVFKCKHCEFETTKKEGMANHIIDNHLKTNTILCDYCDFKCSKKSDIAQHSQDVHDIEYRESVVENLSMYHCEQCSYETQKKILLTRHMENVHEKLPKKPFIKCQVIGCDFKTRRPDRMTQHVGKVHENNDRPFQCDQCLFKFTAQKSLDKHISAVHHQIKPYLCNFCTYKSAYQKQLTWHINTVHHNIRPYVCTTCGYKAAQKRNLARHIQTAHEKRYPFKCGLCSYEAARKEQVTKHIRATHEGIKPIQCQFCEYRYSKNHNITVIFFLVQEIFTIATVFTFFLWRIPYKVIIYMMVTLFNG